MKRIIIAITLFVAIAMTSCTKTTSVNGGVEFTIDQVTYQSDKAEWSKGINVDAISSQVDFQMALSNDLALELENLNIEVPGEYWEMVMDDSNVSSFTRTDDEITGSFKVRMDNGSNRRQWCSGTITKILKRP